MKLTHGLVQEVVAAGREMSRGRSIMGIPGVNMAEEYAGLYRIDQFIKSLGIWSASYFNAGKIGLACNKNSSVTYYLWKVKDGVFPKRFPLDKLEIDWRWENRLNLSDIDYGLTVFATGHVTNNLDIPFSMSRPVPTHGFLFWKKPYSGDELVKQAYEEMLRIYKTLDENGFIDPRLVDRDMVSFTKNRDGLRTLRPDQ